MPKIRSLCFLFAVFCVVTFCLFSRVSYAQEAQIPCDPEPTEDMSVSYGDIVACQIDFVGDL